MSLEEGVRTAVTTCMGLKQNEKVVIASDKDTMNIGKKLREVALEITPHVRFFNLDIYGKRPLSHFPDAIREAAEDADVGFWTANSFEGELESIRGPFIKAVMNRGRHGHMVNINEEVIETALAVDYEKIKEFTDKLYDKLIKTDKVRITNDQGTDITASFSDRWKWVPSAGICHEQGHWNNIPDGEVFTAPKEMDGKMVVDGVIGEYFGNKYSHEDLKETPITIKIKTNSRAKAIDVSCDNDELEKEVYDYIHLHDCSPFIGELGFGTNIFLKELSGNMLQDEKFPGVHVAFGDPMADETYADWTCPEHLDMILTRCNVWLDDEKIMENGEYLMEKF